MLITKWIEKVGEAIICGNNCAEIAISASSPLAIASMLEQKFDPKTHHMAALIRFTDSKYCLFIETPNNVPMFDVIDPCTGRYFIKYDEKDPGDKRYIRVEAK